MTPKEKDPGVNVPANSLWPGPAISNTANMKRINKIAISNDKCDLQLKQALTEISTAAIQ